MYNESNHWIASPSPARQKTEKGCGRLQRSRQVMIMRELFMYIFSLIIVGLGICAYFAFLSPKPIGKSVGWLIASLIPAVFGNLLIVSSNTETSTLIGCYCYYIGMDLVMLALLRYTREY